MVENEAYERGLPENYAPMLVENIKKGGYTHVIVGHSSFGKSLLPRVAALLDVQQLSDVMAIESEDSKFSFSLSVASVRLVNEELCFVGVWGESPAKVKVVVSCRVDDCCFDMAKRGERW